jgi:DNA repair exonuclease SbcCD ATPase subunit
MEEQDEIVTRLRGISSDEKSEMGKMKCRIDDQARLIMMLKKRNDEYICGNMALDRHAAQLEQQIDQLRQQIDEQQHAHDELQRARKTIEQLQTSNLQWQRQEQNFHERTRVEQQERQSMQTEVAAVKQQLDTLQHLLKFVSSRAVLMSLSSRLV